MKDQYAKIGKTAKRSVPKTWVIASAIAVGIAVLCLAIGIPTKDDKTIHIRELTTLIMPFNFANDKFAEFKFFVETIQQKWGTNPEKLLNLQEYIDPDKYGHSAYAIEDTGLIVEFYYFNNRLYQSTINIQDSGEVKKWVGYLDSKFGVKKPDGKFFSWNKDGLKIVYASESETYRFHFVHMETFLAGQAYRNNVDSNLARFMEFKKVIDNRVIWNTSPESLPNISLYKKNQSNKWDIYTHNNVTNLVYHFFQNKLCGIDFLISDTKEAKKMYGILQIKFGEGENEGDNGRKWEVSGITIISTPYNTARWFIFRHKETWTEKEKFAIKMHLQENKIAEKKK